MILFMLSIYFYLDIFLDTKNLPSPENLVRLRKASISEQQGTIETLKSAVADLRTQLCRAHQATEKERRSVRALKRDLVAQIR
jgi:hypothetical protein